MGPNLCSHEDSNPNFVVRSHTFYPLNYGNLLGRPRKTRTPTNGFGDRYATNYTSDPFLFICGRTESRTPTPRSTVWYPNRWTTRPLYHLIHTYTIYSRVARTRIELAISTLKGWRLNQFAHRAIKKARIHHLYATKTKSWKVSACPIPLRSQTAISKLQTWRSESLPRYR